MQVQRSAEKAIAEIELSDEDTNEGDVEGEII